MHSNGQFKYKISLKCEISYKYKIEKLFSKSSDLGPFLSKPNRFECKYWGLTGDACIQTANTNIRVHSNVRFHANLRFRYCHTRLHAKKNKIQDFMQIKGSNIRLGSNIRFHSNVSFHANIRFRYFCQIQDFMQIKYSNILIYKTLFKYKISFKCKISCKWKIQIF